MSGVDHFEGRLTKHYRFTYAGVDEEIQFLTIGPHASLEVIGLSNLLLSVITE